MATLDAARDGYAAYYTEKLWEAIPSHYRHEDGVADPPGVLRAFVEVIAAQAAEHRRRDDRLWDDSFVELADSWAVAYLADLVATRLVSATNPRGRRADVAKTIYYRRRKGTPRVLEELVADITGWDGKVVEAFRRLGRTHHGLDPVPGPRAGRFTGTPPGGTADLRKTRVAVASEGPFDEYAHTPEMRRQRGRDGRWGIPQVAFHLYRLAPSRVDGVTPFVRADQRTFTFDPSGRDVALYAQRRRISDWDRWHSALPWELPGPLTCRLLGHAEYVVTERLVVALEDAGLSAAGAADLRHLAGTTFPDEAAVRAALGRAPSAAELTGGTFLPKLLAGALVDECGKRALIGPVVRVSVGGVPFETHRTESGYLGDAAWSLAIPTDIDAVIDPERGRGKLRQQPAGAITVRYHYALAGDLGAGSYDRDDLPAPTVSPPAGGGPIAALPPSGVVQLADDATYTGLPNVPAAIALRIQAADRRRPYLRLQAPWIVTSAAGREAELTLDGLWLGAAGAHEIVLRGAWKRVTFTSVTLDPGGRDADGGTIHPVPLVVEAQVDELIVRRSIVHRLSTRAGGMIDHVRILDSIVDAPGQAALAFPAGETHLHGVTVLGRVDADLLWASDTLVTEKVTVTDTQHGCFRFSAAPAGSRLPHPFESVVTGDARPYFTSRRFGDPGYAQLSAAAPERIQRGAESGSEMGAFGFTATPIKLDGLAAKVTEYLPFGLIPLFLFET